MFYFGSINLFPNGQESIRPLAVNSLWSTIGTCGQKHEFVSTAVLEVDKFTLHLNLWKMLNNFPCSELGIHFLIQQNFPSFSADENKNKRRKNYIHRLDPLTTLKTVCILTAVKLISQPWLEMCHMSEWITVFPNSSMEYYLNYLLLA